MANMLRNGVTWLQGQRKASMSDSATYTRAGFAPITDLAVTPGTPNFAIDDGNTIRVASTQQDWIITAADLVINGSPTLPQKGDRLTIAQGAQAGTFEVQIPETTDKPYKLDATGQQIRAHTKRISA